jgi:glycosyltransferase involved in cell wall biosynthesis
MLAVDKQPLVSILLNCFNASKFISKAIVSVLQQTYHNWELVIWDDGSTDKTLQIVKKFLDKRIKIFSQSVNVGLGKSRIAASQKLDGKFISILDADDYYDSEKLAKQVEVFLNFPNVAICSTWTKFYNEKRKLIRLFNNYDKIDNFRQKLKFINLLPHSSIMYRKNSAKKVGWYSNNLEYSQDYDLTLKLINNYELYIVNKYLTHIVKQPDSMTNQKDLSVIRLKENIIITKNNFKLRHTKDEKKIFNLILDIYFLKLYLHDLKKNFINSITQIFMILFKNPLIIFKFNFLKKIKDKI